MFQGIVSRVKNYLSKTSDQLSSKVTGIFKNKKLDNQALEELKEALISTDVDYQTATLLVNELSQSRFNKEVTDEEVKVFLAEKVINVLLPLEKKFEVKSGFQIVMFCGVNGNGKTTTIAKLAYKFKLEGKRVMVAPCDTFRAAAQEQLDAWVKKIGCEIFITQNTKDPASVAYQAILKAKESGMDILFIDTAGRLHTNTDLMNELKKIFFVVKKFASSVFHETVLVLDATVGQNAFNQIRLFKEVIDIDGIIITKLDGTAKAGVVIGIANQFKGLKLYAVGTGESWSDLQNFSAKRFAYNLLGIEEDLYN